jgi:tetratricopeptide (TPR) repeat protein
LKLPILLLLLASVAFPLCAASEPPPAMRRAYENLRDAAYNNAPIGRIESLYREALAKVEAAGLEAPIRFYWLGRVEYMSGRGYQAWERKEEAGRHYEAGLELTRRALEAGDFSEGWRMMSEHQGQLCVVKDFGYLLANGPKVLRYAKKAAELDPENVAAQILLAAAKIYPPPIAGGNPTVGIELMRRALSLGGAEADDLFNIYSGIGVAYAKLGDFGQSARWLELALELYPNNRYVREEYEKLSL